jgi:hypothetical protein
MRAGLPQRFGGGGADAAAGAGDERELAGEGFGSVIAKSLV